MFNRLPALLKTEPGQYFAHLTLCSAIREAPCQAAGSFSGRRNKRRRGLNSLFLIASPKPGAGLRPFSLSTSWGQAPAGCDPARPASPTVRIDLAVVSAESARRMHALHHQVPGAQTRKRELYRITSSHLRRITFSRTSAAPVGRFAPRSNCET
jgi:hypothetical protein